MPSAWVFGEVEIRPAERRVLRAGVPQALGGRAFDLLLALIERRANDRFQSTAANGLWPLERDRSPKQSLTVLRS